MHNSNLEYVGYSLRLETAFRKFDIEDYPPRSAFEINPNEAIQNGLKVLHENGHISTEVLSDWLNTYNFSNMTLKEVLICNNQRQKIDNLLSQLDAFSKLQNNI